MERDLRIAVFGQKRLSREGGVEIVVKELCTRMAQQGCQVTCYNRSGHHVSGAEYDDIDNTNYEGIRQKSVPTIEKKGARDIIRGCHNRDKGTAENERLRNPKFIFSYPKNERMIFDDKPALYHCELEIVDENLEHIKMTRNCNKTKFIDQTLMVFYIPGCTMVFNNCLMRKIQERKPEFDLITMHDCWLYYICLGIGGKIISDKNAYIQYRQHGNNVIGAKRISIRKKIQMICQQNGSPRAKMIDEIIRLYGQDMKKEMLSKYKTFASYPKSIKAKNYFFKQSTENVFSTRELQKAKLRILFGSL